MMLWRVILFIFHFVLLKRINKNLVFRHLLLETNNNAKMEIGKEQKGQERGAATGRSQRPVHEAQQYLSLPPESTGLKRNP